MEVTLCLLMQLGLQPLPWKWLMGPSWGHNTPLEWGRVVARAGSTCLEQGCACAIPHTGAIICVPEVQKQADSLGSCEQKASRLTCFRKA